MSKKYQTFFSFDNGENVKGISLRFVEYQKFIVAFDLNKKKLRNSIIRRRVFGSVLILALLSPMILGGIFGGIGVAGGMFFLSVFASAFGMGNAIEHFLTKHTAVAKLADRSPTSYRVCDKSSPLALKVFDEEFWQKMCRKEFKNETVKEIVELMLIDCSLYVSSQKMKKYVSERLESPVAIQAANTNETIEEKREMIAERFKEINRLVMEENDSNLLAITDDYIDKRDAEILREINKVNNMDEQKVLTS